MGRQGDRVNKLIFLKTLLFWYFFDFLNRVRVRLKKEVKVGDIRTLG
jgi:hypothetical protein